MCTHAQTNFLKLFGVWRANSVVKSTGYFSGGSKFNSQHLPCVLQPCTVLVPGFGVLFRLCGYQVLKYTYLKNTYTHKEKNVKLFRGMNYTHVV